jgi:hypothetical protein
VVREIKGGNSKDAVLFTEAKDKKKSFIFCNVYENKLTCENEDEKKIIEADAPLSKIPKKNSKKVNIKSGDDRPDISYMDDSYRVGFPKAVWVNLQKDKPKYLAVIGSFGRIGRSNFYLYDEKGNLVYHELLPEDARTIAVNSTANSTDEIFIGGKDTIWKFVAK